MQEEAKEKRAEIQAAKATGKEWLEKHKLNNPCVKCIELAKEVETLKKRNESLASDLDDSKSSVQVKALLVRDLREQLDQCVHKATPIPGQPPFNMYSSTYTFIASTIPHLVNLRPHFIYLFPPPT